MARYQTFQYGSGTLYGEASRVAFSAEPVSAVAVSHSEVLVKWTKPANTNTVSYVGFRLVRNQEAFPETEEDGVILYEFYTKTSEIVTLSSYTDGSDPISGVTTAPLVPGRFAYYRAWILLDEIGEWVRAGDAYTLLPSSHLSGTGPNTVGSEYDPATSDSRDMTVGSQALTSTHDRMLDLIPRVFLSANKGPIDAIQDYDSEIDAKGGDENSLLKQFLYGFALTADEFLTYAEFISPESSGRNTDPEILKLQSQQLNLTFDTAGVSKSQKKMVREALYTYRRKGTVLGLQTLVEAVTGYDAVITESPNLMLSVQDSTFFHGIGGWVANTGCTLVADGFTQATPTVEDEPSAIDVSWVGKAVVTTSGTTIKNGMFSPTTRAVPVSAGEEYSFSGYIRKTDGALAYTARIHWYDRNGLPTGDSTGNSSAGVGITTWQKFTVTAEAPAAAVYVGIEIELGSTGTFYLDMIQLSKSATTSFHEARGVDIFLGPKKTNYLTDPSFEGDLTAWEIDADSYSAEPLRVNAIYDGPLGARTGLKKLVAVSNASGSSSIQTSVTFTPTKVTSIQPVQGAFHTFSFYAKASTTVAAKIRYEDSTTAIHDKDIVLTTEWQRFYITHFVKFLNYTTNVTAFLSLIGDFGGATIEMDSAQLEASYYPTDYFDGGLTLSGGAWAGAANDSVSYFYPARYNKLVRLTNEIEKYLPINTPYIVRTYQNDDATVPPFGIS